MKAIIGLGNPEERFANTRHNVGFRAVGILAQKLGVKPGIYTHSISNAHVYDIHYEAAKEITERTNNHKNVTLHLPENAFDRAEKSDRTLADAIIGDLTEQYNPSETIKGLKIVL